MQTNHSSQIREFNPETDFPALAALCTAIESVDQAGEPTREEALRGQTHVQRWILADPGAPATFLGHGAIYVQSAARCYLDIAVHPGWRRKGLGSALLEYGIQLGKSKGCHQIVVSIRLTNRGAAAFLQRYDFGIAGHDRVLSTPASFSPAAPHWPDGYSVRSQAEIGIERGRSIAAQAFNACYTDLWAHAENNEPQTEEKLKKRVQQYPLYFIPEAIFIAFAPDGSIAGISSGRLEELEAATDTQPARYHLMVDAPAAAPAHRHLGLENALVLHTMHWLRTRGDDSIDLYTFGDSEENIAGYKELGFTLKDENHWLEYLFGTWR